jgi:hypothetical protein
MFGVVLWSCQKDRTAVVWCDDHGDLAVFRQQSVSFDGKGTPSPGDLLRVEVEERDGIRLVDRATLVAADHFSGLGDALKTAAVDADAPVVEADRPEGANILLFPPAAPLTEPELVESHAPRSAAGR